MSTKKIILSLALFSLMGCNCSTKKNIIISRQYNTIVEESRVSLQDDFITKAGNKVYFGECTITSTIFSDNILTLTTVLFKSLWRSVKFFGLRFNRL